MWLPGEIKNLKREESLWNARQIVSVLLPRYSISRVAPRVFTGIIGQLSCWMPCLPLASRRGSRHRITWGEHRVLLGRDSWAQGAARGCRTPSRGHPEEPARAGAPAAAAGLGAGLRGWVGSAPAAPVHQAGLDKVQEQRPQPEHPSPARSRLLLTCTRSLASSCTSLWYKRTRAGSLGVREKLENSFSRM